MIRFMQIHNINLINEDKHFLVYLEKHDIKILHKILHKFHISILNDNAFNMNFHQVNVCIKQNVNENFTTRMIMQKSNALTFHKKAYKVFNNFLKSTQDKVLNVKIIL